MTHSAFLDAFSLEKVEPKRASLPSRSAFPPNEDSALYRATIPDGWGAPIHPNGGVVSALALGAMARELGIPEHTLRTSTTMFTSIVEAGEVEIEVDVIRRGRRMSQLRARLRNRGSEDGGHHVTAAFGEAREGLTIGAETLAPDVGSPSDYEPTPVPPEGVPAFRPGFMKRIDTRRVKMFQSWEEGWEGGVAEAMRWTRYRETPGPVDMFGLLPISDTMPSAIGQFLGPKGRFFHAPSVDLTFHAIAEPRSEWILSRTRTRWADDGYGSGEVHLWDESRRLVAYATQLMVLRFPDPEVMNPGKTA